MENNVKEMYTKDQVVGFTINILAGLKIPAEQCEEIGVPIAKAIKNLRFLEMMLQAEKETNEPAKQPEDEEAEENGNADAE